MRSIFIFSLNLLLFSIELILIEPNPNCVPGNEKNFEVWRMYRDRERDYELMLEACRRGGGKNFAKKIDEILDVLVEIDQNKVLNGEDKKDL